MAGFSGSVNQALISIIHPVRHIRPSTHFPIAWRGAHDSWLARCDHPNNVEYVLCANDADYDELLNSAMLISCPKFAWLRFVMVRNEGRDSWFQQTAAAVRAATGLLLALAQDDEQPLEHWDRLLIEGDARFPVR